MGIKIDRRLFQISFPFPVEEDSGQESRGTRPARNPPTMGNPQNETIVLHRFVRLRVRTSSPLFYIPPFFFNLLFLSHCSPEIGDLHCNRPFFCTIRVEFLLPVATHCTSSLIFTRIQFLFSVHLLTYLSTLKNTVFCRAFIYSSRSLLFFRDVFSIIIIIIKMIIMCM